MQDRYAGDIGDYVKIAILRELSPGWRLGVGWWLYPDESHNGDGRHISYLHNPLRWRPYDPNLFDHLGRVVAEGRRTVASLQGDHLLPDTVYFDEVIPTVGTTNERRRDRGEWLGRLRTALDQCDLIFLDPDNGLETKNFSLGARKAGKSVAISELLSLRRPGRTLIVYHHQTRMAGGHMFELEHWGARLRQAGFNRVDALRAAAFSARAFFLLDAPDEMRLRAEGLARRWAGKIAWCPDLGAEAHITGSGTL